MAARSRDDIRRGASLLSGLTKADRDWVAAELVRAVPAADRDALCSLASLLSAHMKRPSVFLSHNSEDKPFVRELARYLSDHGFRVWLDEACLTAGVSLLSALADAVMGVDVVVAVLSKNAVSSAWVTKELQIAMTQEVKNRRIKVIPILKEKCDMPAFLSDKLYLDFTTSAKRTRNRPTLIASIIEHVR
jgi:hypothetical protein